MVASGPSLLLGQNEICAFCVESMQLVHLSKPDNACKAVREAISGFTSYIFRLLVAGDICSACSVKLFTVGHAFLTCYL